MSSSLRQIRTALAATISQSGLNVYETVPDVSNSPAAVILPDDADYANAMGMGGDTYYFSVAIMVAAHNIRDAQDQLDEYVTGKGTKSVREFLFHNGDLGLPDVDSFVKGYKGYGGSYKTAMTNSVGAVLKVCVVVL